jgi:hypothetical protein
MKTNESITISQTETMPKRITYVIASQHDVLGHFISFQKQVWNAMPSYACHVGRSIAQPCQDPDYAIAH